MSASAGATSSASVYTTAAFWERLWRTAGIQSGLCFIVAYIIYGHQPQVGASTDAIAAFYDGDRMRILIATVFYGLAVLNLMWFAAALRTTLADAGQDGWGAAATASSAALGSLFLLLIAVVAALAYSIAGSVNHMFTSGLNDFVWAFGRRRVPELNLRAFAESWLPPGSSGNSSKCRRGPSAFRDYLVTVVFKIKKPTASGTVISKVSRLSPSRQWIWIVSM